jgi:hypothetical protein
MRRGVLLLVACLFAVLLLAAASAPAQRGEECSWGASSVIAEQVNGEYVQSEPATSGCIPR